MRQPTTLIQKSAYDRFIDPKGPTQDLAGLLAYAIYKSAKREWTVKQVKAQGRPLTTQEANVFLDTLTPTVERQMKNDADDLLKIFAADAVQRESPKIVDKAVQNITNQALANHTVRSTFWNEVGSGVTAAAIWSFLLIVLGVIVAVADVDIFVYLERLHKLIHPGT